MYRLPEHGVLPRSHDLHIEAGTDLQFGSGGLGVYASVEWVDWSINLLP